MALTFKNTDNFDTRYDAFINEVGLLNNKYESYFERKHSETGHYEFVEQHIEVEQSSDKVKLCFIKKTWIPDIVKIEVANLFRKHFNSK